MSPGMPAFWGNRRWNSKSATGRSSRSGSATQTVSSAPSASSWLLALDVYTSARLNVFTAFRHQIGSCCMRTSHDELHAASWQAKLADRPVM